MLFLFKAPLSFSDNTDHGYLDWRDREIYSHPRHLHIGQDEVTDNYNNLTIDKNDNCIDNDFIIEELALQSRDDDLYQIHLDFFNFSNFPILI